MKVDLTLDRSLAWGRGGSVRYLRALITAPPAALNLKTTPRNLAIALDTSGSMQGPSLSTAKAAILRVLDLLGPEDIFSLIAFNSDVTGLSDALPLTPENRSGLLDRLRTLEATAQTNLSQGWLTAARSAAIAMERFPEYHHHVIVLSDGQANQGQLDPATLGIHAAELRARGLPTSAIGIGEGYSQTQLKPIADHGGGRLHDAQHTHEIIEVISAELTDILSTAARDLELTLLAPADVEAECLSSFPSRITRGKLRAQLGMLPHSRQRDCVFLLKLPAGQPGTTLPFAVRLSWVDSEGQSQTFESNPIDITFASGTDNTAQPRDIPTSLRVAECWQNSLVERAVDLNRRGDFDEISALLRQELQHFRRYVDGLPGGEAMVDNLQHLYKSAHRYWDERKRKELAQYSVNSRRIDPDSRLQRRAPISDQFRDL